MKFLALALVLLGGSSHAQDYGHTYNDCLATAPYVKYVTDSIAGIKKVDEKIFPPKALRDHIDWSIDGAWFGNYYTDSYPYTVGNAAPIRKHIIFRSRLVDKKGVAIAKPHDGWDVTSEAVKKYMNVYQCLQNGTYVVMLIMFHTNDKTSAYQ